MINISDNDSAIFQILPLYVYWYLLASLLANQYVISNALFIGVYLYTYNLYVI